MNIKLINNEAIKTLENLIENGVKVDCIITDPPYLMTKRGKSCRPNWMPNNMGENVFKYDLPEPEIWFKLCYDILQDNSHFYTFCNTNDLMRYLNIAQKTGFKLHNVITMIKDTLMPNRWYLKQTELILFFRKGKAKPINILSSRDNFNVIMPTQKSGKLHITQKPLEIIENFVLNSSNIGETILDPFMGSGTTGLAALKNNRKFIGIEIDEHNFNIAKDRLEKVK